MKQKLQRSDHFWSEVSERAQKVLHQKRQCTFGTRLNAGKHAAALRKSEPAYSNVFEVLVYGKAAGQVMSPQQASKSLLPTPKRRKRKQRKHPGRTRELQPKRQRYHRERRAKLKRKQEEKERNKRLRRAKLKRARERERDDRERRAKLQREKEGENEEIQIEFDFGDDYVVFDNAKAQLISRTD